jgi:peptidoglycan/xylan/chitin deacetylase (PgdA/CDA1 family)
MNRRARWAVSWAGVALLGLSGAAARAVTFAAPTQTRDARLSRSAKTRTIVSLEFDHATSDDMIGAQLAAAHGMKVTMFALSGRIGSPGYMTLGELLALQARGDEIGGHTIDHPDLAQLPAAAQRHEICDDRAALERDGLDVTDFAYPYGYYNGATIGIVRACGYQSARTAGGVGPHGGCVHRCPFAETIPPRDPFRTRAASSTLETTGIATIEGYVTEAERHGGGWVQIVFHHVCDQCDTYSISPQKLAVFLAWLARRSAIGTKVQTVRQVINTPFRPARIRARIGSGPDVGLTSARSCPRTPVSAPCSVAPGVRPQPLTASRPARLVVLTARNATRVELLRRRRSPLRLTPSHGQPLRWSVELPASDLRGSATIEVTYPLGRAYYRIVLLRRPARPALAG